MIRRHADGTLLCKGTTQNVFTSADDNKVVRLNDTYFNRLKAAYEKDKEELVKDDDCG